MTDSNIEKKEIQKAPHEQKEFKGYSLDELKYQRALLLLKREHSKEKFLKNTENLRKRLPFGNHDGGQQKVTASLSKGIVGKLVGSLNYVDYIVLGLSVFGTGRKVLSLFRKFKK